MEQLFTLDNLVTLALLILLQAVLGFDNLLYISLESQRAPADKQAIVRRNGILIAIGLRIFLLFALMALVKKTQKVLFTVDYPGILEGQFNLHSIIVFVGGVFIIYTATKEVLHMIQLEEADGEPRKQKSVTAIICWIVTMNLVFSFDSILSAMALSDDFIVMATAIIVSGILMLVLANTVSEFLKKNRMYEVLGLFILFVVGIMLLSEAGHLSHLKILNEEIQQMTKGTFYFVIGVLVMTDIVQRPRKYTAPEIYC